MRNFLAPLAILATASAAYAWDTWNTSEQGSRALDVARAEDELFALLPRQRGFDHVEYRDGTFVIYYGGCMLIPLPSSVPTTWRGHPVVAGACGIAACPPHRHHRWHSDSKARPA